MAAQEASRRKRTPTHGQVVLFLPGQLSLDRKGLNVLHIGSVGMGRDEK